MGNKKIISAGAGSGKTYRLTTEMVAMLSRNEDPVRASGIIATTFTNKAAAELQERVRVRLLEKGMRKEANDLANAMIGTVHGLGVNLLKRFAFEAGVSPEVDIMAEEDQQVMFNQSLSQVLTMDVTLRMTELTNKLGLNKSGPYDWRKDVKQVTEIARANDFSIEVLEKSKKLSFESFCEYLPKGAKGKSAEWHERLKCELEETISNLEANEDETKVTKTATQNLKSALNDLNVRGELFWHQWAKIGKTKVGAKSREAFEPLAELAKQHEQCIDFQNDIKAFIYQLFDLAIDGIEEYQRYKKQRGLIDYTDMEALVKNLLSHPQVTEVLREELDLLMVDEFQDTSPMQLEIFLKLSELANESVWVGDPKQSIYGFRGAAPELMEAIVADAGGIKAENIQEYSWRSRQDIVFATNAIFTKVFESIPKEQVRLIPKRENKVEPDTMTWALNHWHFRKDPELKRMPGKPWMENCLADFIRQELDRGVQILPKGEEVYRNARAGDVAVLCRSNRECQTVADALHRVGLKAAISRSALLKTAEASLILACLKFILNRYDTLSLAEVLKLHSAWTTKEIIEHRLDYLAENENSYQQRWAEEVEVIKELNDLRHQVIELSSSEILNLLLDELDLRRIIVQWGNQEQRLANVDVLLKFSLQYEEACNRLHTAASLGGFLLWLNDLESKEKDTQGSGEGPNAVNVLTYHKSKGLEYPITICHSLENVLRDDLWGIEIVAEKDEVDLSNLLGNRWLRYWVNPYGNQSKGTALVERMRESEEQQRKTRQAVQEEARLMYVGITRARDYLVFPSREGKATNWLNRVWHGAADQPTLDPTQNDSQWLWNDEVLPIQNRSAYYGQAFQETLVPLEPIPFINSPFGKQPHQPYHIDLKTEKIQVQQKLTALHKSSFAPPLEITEEADKSAIIKALNGFLIADHPTYPPAQRQAIATGLIERFEIKEWIEPQKMVRQSQAYFDFLNKQFPDAELLRSYQIKLWHQNRLFETQIDNLLITNELAVIVKFSNFAGGAKKLDAKLNEYGDWFFLSENGVRDEYKGLEVKRVVVFLNLGLIVEV